MEKKTNEGCGQRFINISTTSVGVSRIATERCRQINTLGYTTDRDSKYSFGKLAVAACAYLTGDIKMWPFHSMTFHCDKEDRLRNLEKAGALIAAEIDRLLYIKNNGKV